MSIERPLVYVLEEDTSECEPLRQLIHSSECDVEFLAETQDILTVPLPQRRCCLILDVVFRGQSCLDLQQKLSMSQPNLPVIFLTGRGDISMAVRAMKAGAVDFLTRPANAVSVLTAIATAHGLHNMLSADVELKARYATLTLREREIMRLVTDGSLNKQIAADLTVSEVTVKVHRSQVMRKMQAKSLPDLVRMADRLGLGSGATRQQEGVKP